MNDKKLEIILENIYESDDSISIKKADNKKTLSLSLKDFTSMITNILNKFPNLFKYKNFLIKTLFSNSNEIKQLKTAVGNTSNLPIESSVKIYSDIIQNIYREDGKEITNLKPILTKIFKEKSYIQYAFSLFNFLNQIIKKDSPISQIEKIDNFEDIKVNQFFTYLYENINSRVELEIINEITSSELREKFKKEKQETVNIAKQIEKAIDKAGDAKGAGLIKPVDDAKGAGVKKVGKLPVWAKIMMAFSVLLIAGPILGQAVSATGTTNVNLDDHGGANNLKFDIKKIDVNEMKGKIIGDEDVEKADSLKGDIEGLQKSSKQIETLKGENEALNKELLKLKDSFTGKFGFTDSGTKIKEIEAKLKNIDKTMKSIGDNEAIKKDIQEKQNELQKIEKEYDQKVNTFDSIFKHISEGGEKSFDKAVEDSIKQMKTKGALDFLKGASDTAEKIDTIKSDLVTKIMNSYENNNDFKNSSDSQKQEFVKNIIKNVENGKNINVPSDVKLDVKEIKDALKDIQVKENLVSKYKIAAEKISSSPTTDEEIKIFNAKLLVNQVLDSDYDQDIGYIYDISDGSVKIDTTTKAYEKIMNDYKEFKTDPTVKQFLNEVEKLESSTIDAIKQQGELVKKIDQLKQKATELETQKKAAGSNIKKLNDIQQKIDVNKAQLDKAQDEASKDQKLKESFDKLMKNFKLYDAEDDIEKVVDGTFKMMDSLKLDAKISSKIDTTNKINQMKALGIKDLNQFEAYKNLSKFKTEDWNANDNQQLIKSGIDMQKLLKALQIEDKEGGETIKNNFNGKAGNFWVKNADGTFSISNAQGLSDMVDMKLSSVKADTKVTETKAETKDKVAETKVETKDTKDTKVETKDTKEENKTETKEEAQSKAISNSFNAIKDQSDGKDIIAQKKIYKDNENKIKDSESTAETKEAAKIAMKKAEAMIKTLLPGNSGNNFVATKHIDLLTESKKRRDVNDLFAILEQNYFKK
jgi:hypothetical protein